MSLLGVTDIVKPYHPYRGQFIRGILVLAIYFLYIAEVAPETLRIPNAVLPDANYRPAIRRCGVGGHTPYFLTLIWPPLRSLRGIQSMLYHRCLGRHAFLPAQYRKIPASSHGVSRYGMSTCHLAIFIMSVGLIYWPSDVYTTKELLDGSRMG